MSALIVLHPLLIFFASNIVLTLTAAYTHRGSALRYGAIGFFAVCTYVLPWSLDYFAGTTGWVGRVPAGAVFWNIISCSDRLILRGWGYNHYGTDKASAHGADDHHGSKTEERTTTFTGTRMDFGSEVSGNARGAGLFWEVKNVPNFSEANPGYVPSRVTFIFVQIIAVFTCYYLQNLAAEFCSTLDLNLISSAYVPLLSRFPEVSFVELKTRFGATLAYWTMQYTMMQFFYSFAAIISAISSPDSIKDWRPLFGSPRDAYTVRDTWGKSWHQTLRSGLEGVSASLTHDALRLPRNGLLQRYTKIFFSFAISGVMHIFADMGGGLSRQQSGALQFFTMQALGIVLEDSVQAIYRQYFADRSGGRNDRFGRAVGYVWVLFFIVWTSPVWIYPAMLNMRKEDAMLSFEAVKPLFLGRNTLFRDG